jgi:hypothetical protein
VPAPREVDGKLGGGRRVRRCVRAARRAARLVGARRHAEGESRELRPLEVVLRLCHARRGARAGGLLWWGARGLIDVKNRARCVRWSLL